MRRILLCLLIPLGLVACSGGPNVKSAKDYSAASGAPGPEPPLQSLCRLRRGQRDMDTTRVQPRWHHHETGGAGFPIRPPGIRVCSLGHWGVRWKPLRAARHVLTRPSLPLP